MKQMILLVLSMILLTGFSSVGDAVNEGTYTQISQETAKEMMSRDDGHVIVDVRRQDEYDVGHIPGAVLIPNESIGTEMPVELPDLDQIILVYCRSGNRSRQAVEKLAQMGYTGIYEFGGIINWTGEIVTTAEEHEAGAEEEKESGTAVLSFSSFDGGGYVYSAEIGDPSVLTYTFLRDYGTRDELDTGSPYEAVFTFTGLKPGKTVVNIYGVSPVAGNDDSIYMAVVDDMLNVTLKAERQISSFFLDRSGEIRYDNYNISHGRDGYHVSVNDGPEQYIDRKTADDLMQVIEAYDLAGWDGFDASADNVLDGESFWLDIRLTDGSRILAQGDNVYPENYAAAISRIQEILDNAATESSMALEGRTDVQEMKIRVTDGTHTIVYQLNNSAPAASLYDMLPFDVPVENYGSNEKIFYPAGDVYAQDGIEGGGEAGGLALFSPWGNVVMYYDSFGAYPGLYILGEAVEGMEQVRALSGMVHVEKAE